MVFLSLKMCQRIIIILTCLLLISLNNCRATKDLHIMGFHRTNASHPLARFYLPVLHGALMAINDINNRSDLLSGYNFKVIYHDDEVIIF